MPRLAVSVVNWNTAEQLRRCLTALLAAKASVDLEITVVDNASEDGSAQLVRDEFPMVRLLALPSNTGFAAANNQGLHGSAADYVMTLNPDVEVDAVGLKNLLSFMDSTPSAAAVGPLLIGHEGVVHSHMYRRFPSRMQVLLFWTVLRRIATQVEWLRLRYLEHDLSGTDLIEVEQIPGAALLIRGSEFEAVGEMDPDYFIWFEDVDWCYRARRRGGRLYVLPAATMRHEGSVSFRLWSDGTKAFQFYRAFFRFLGKHDLSKLNSFALRVIECDLWLKERFFSVRSLKSKGKDSKVPTLRVIRRELRRVHALYQQGESVRFTGAAIPSTEGPSGESR